MDCWGGEPEKLTMTAPVVANIVRDNASTGLIEQLEDQKKLQERGFQFLGQATEVLTVRLDRAEEKQGGVLVELQAVRKENAELKQLIVMLAAEFESLRELLPKLVIESAQIIPRYSSEAVIQGTQSEVFFVDGFEADEQLSVWFHEESTGSAFVGGFIPDGDFVPWLGTDFPDDGFAFRGPMEQGVNLLFVEVDNSGWTAELP